MSELKVLKIEFFCDYVIKVIGNVVLDFREFVVEVVGWYVSGLIDVDVLVNDSSKGWFFFV